MELLDGRLKCPFSMIVAGSSQCGKTTFCLELLKQRDDLLDTKIDKIIWISGRANARDNVIENLSTSHVMFLDALPENFDNLFDVYRGQNLVIVFDDLMEQTARSEQVLNLFIKDCHHRNISLILCMQDIFFGSGGFRKTFLRNANYLALFSSPMDMGVVDAIARKVMPRRLTLFFRIFESATSSEDYGHLFISGHPKTHPRIKFRSRLLQPVQFVYEIKHR